MCIKTGRKNGMKLVWCLISFTKFYRNFQTNYHFVIQGKTTHIGHSYLTRSFSLRGEDAPVCVACGAVITVRHILIKCADLLEIRKNILKRDLCIHSFGTWFREKKQKKTLFWFLARDWCVLQNMKCIKVMFVWSVFKELCIFFMWNVLQLFNEQLEDKLKFVFSLDAILCGWLGSKHKLTN